MSRFFAGLDLGQSDDYTAMCVVEAVKREDGSEGLDLGMADRIRGMSYPEVVRLVGSFMREPMFKVRTKLIVDATGVGKPVADMLREEGLDFTAVHIHAGFRESHEGGIWNVPKRNLVAALQIALQSRHFRIAKGLDVACDLEAELRNFKVTINTQTAHEGYSAWREKEHDDLVLAAALACWGVRRFGATPGEALLLRKESYWTGADGEQEASRPPIERDGWHRVGDPAFGLWQYEKERR
jgi:hypothetical protein